MGTESTYVNEVKEFDEHDLPEQELFEEEFDEDDDEDDEYYSEEDKLDDILKLD